MSRIHPSSDNKFLLHHQRMLSDNVDIDDDDDDDDDEKESVVVCMYRNRNPRPTTSVKNLTVWKRSSMSFQGTEGFTVYDRFGKLAFRVDNYVYSRNPSHVVLMDGSGKPLLTLKPQLFSMQHQWNGYIYREEEEGDKDGQKSSCSNGQRIFIMRRPSSVPIALGISHKQLPQCEAQVFFTETANKHENHNHNHNHNRHTTEADGPGTRQPGQEPDYRIEGSFWRRNCKIKSTASGEVAAQITRKRTGAAKMGGDGGSTSNTITLSEEVFSLAVQPGFDPKLIMAFVVILDRICFKPFFPLLICS